MIQQSQRSPNFEQKKILSEILLKFVIEIKKKKKV